MNGLREARKKCHLTIQEVADMLGVSKQLVSFWEKGERGIPYSRQQDLAFMFCIDRDCLGEVSKEKTEEFAQLATERCGLLDEEYMNGYYDMFPADVAEKLQQCAEKAQQCAEDPTKTIYGRLSNDKDYQKKLKEEIEKRFTPDEERNVLDQAFFTEQAIVLYEHFNRLVSAYYRTGEQPLMLQKILQTLSDMTEELEKEHS